MDERLQLFLAFVFDDPVGSWLCSYGGVGFVRACVRVNVVCVRGGQPGRPPASIQ